MHTPRHYLNANTFTSSCGAITKPCPLSRSAPSPA
jgi:hypothetical protein